MQNKLRVNRFDEDKSGEKRCSSHNAAQEECPSSPAFVRDALRLGAIIKPKMQQQTSVMAEEPDSASLKSPMNLQLNKKGSLEQP